jgi:hypothetical protein
MTTTTIRKANRRTDLVFAKQQQLADHTSKLSEETSRDASVDIYLDVKKVYQDTSITAAIDSFA